MATDVKRMRYFDGLFMKQDEFTLEQDYHRRIRQLHNTHLHGCGIAFGLKLQPGPNSQEVTVTAGMGIDKSFDSVNGEQIGREVIVSQDTVLDFSIYNPLDEVYVWVEYAEQQADVVPDRGGSEPIHWLERANIVHGLNAPGDPEEKLILGKVNIKSDHTIDSSSIIEEENNTPLRKTISLGGTTVAAGDKNYVVNDTAELDVTSWVDAASNNLDVSRTTASGEVLSGTASFLVSSTASVAADTDYVVIGLNTIDEEDKFQPFVIEFSYKSHGGYAADALRVVVRDITNNADIVPVPAGIPDGQGKFRGTFTTTESSVYEVRIVSSVNGTPFSISLDSVRFGPNDVPVVSSSGGGLGKNYITNPDAEASLSGWTPSVSGNLSVTQTTATGEVLSGAASFLVIANTSVAAQSDYVSIAVNPVDEEDKLQLMALEFSFKGFGGYESESLQVLVRDTTNNVDLVPNPTYIPGGQGKYRGVFTTSTSSTYEVRLISTVSGTPFSIALDSLRLGPNNTVVGPAIGGWIDAGEITWKGTNSDPTPAGVTRNRHYYRRVGSNMEIFGQYLATTTGGDGSGQFYFELPGGYHVDTSVVQSYQLHGSSSFGTANIHRVGLVGGTGVIELLDDRRVSFTTMDSAGDNYIPFNSTYWNWNTENDLFISFQGSIPIAEWQTDTVLSESRIEFVYNTSTDDANNNTNFATGPEGGVVPGVVNAPAKYKRVRFSRPYQHYQLEVKPRNTDQWVNAGDSYYGYHYYSDAGRGMFMRPVAGSDTDFDVQFCLGGVHHDFNYTETWVQEAAAGTHWRVVGSDNPQFVETAPAQFLTSESDVFTPPGTGIYCQMTGNSLTIPPGEWRVQATFDFQASGGNANFGATQGLITLANGNNSNTPTPPLVPIQAGVNGNWDWYTQDSNFMKAFRFDKIVRVKFTTPTTIYAVPLVNIVTPGNARIKTHIWAERLS